MTRTISPIAALAMLTLAGMPAFAQQPTQAQQDALRSNCRSDAMSKCRGKSGAEALACLKQNVASLSPGCQSAVKALNPPAAASAAPPPAAKPAAAAPTPATPAPAAAAAAPAPAAAAPAPAPAPVAAAPAQTAAPPPAAIAAAPAAPAKPAAPKPAAKPVAVAAKPPAASAAPAQPSAAQQDAIKQSCRGDFMSNCSGVQPGGSAALACLQKNASKLSPGCQQAVRAIGAPAAGPTLASAPAGAAAAPAADAPAMPTAAQQSAIQRTCRADFMRSCKGIQPGGPEALACLQRNTAKLSPDCRTAVADIGDAAPVAAAATPAPVAAAPAVHRAGPPGITPAGRVIRRLRERAN